jgi:hypothetical protein
MNEKISLDYNGKLYEAEYLTFCSKKIFNDRLQLADIGLCHRTF